LICLNLHIADLVCFNYGCWLIEFFPYSTFRGVRLAKNEFGSVFGSVLQKNCGFRFGFGFTKLTAVSFFRFVFFALCVV